MTLPKLLFQKLSTDSEQQKTSFQLLQTKSKRRPCPRRKGGNQTWYTAHLPHLPTQVKSCCSLMHPCILSFLPSLLSPKPCLLAFQLPSQTVLQPSFTRRDKRNCCGLIEWLLNCAFKSSEFSIK